MNTIKMSKILALIVVVAMVMAVMPAAFAETKDDVIFVDGKGYKLLSDNVVTDGTFEDGNIANYHSWDGSALIELDPSISVVEEGAKTGTHSMKVTNDKGTGDPTAGFVYQYMLNGGEPVEEEKVYAISMWIKPTKNKITLTMGASDNKDGKDVNNDCNLTGKWGNNNTQGSDQALTSGEWNRAVAVVKTVPQQTVCLEVFPRYSENYLFDDIEIYEVEEIQPDASVTVKYVCGNDVVDESVYTQTGLYPNAEFTPLVRDIYTADAEHVYKVGEPQTITLKSGENTAEIPVTVYKNIVGDNLIKDNNPGFEDGLTGVLDKDGKDIVAGDRYALITDTEKVSEGNQAFQTLDMGSDVPIHTAWTVTGGKKYVVTFDAMATKSNGQNSEGSADRYNQYAWIYANKADAADIIKSGTNVADYGAGSGGGHINLVLDQFIDKTFVVETEADQTVIGFAGSYFNDGAPIWDNFAVYELEDLSGDVSYSIIATTDGTANGTVLGEIKGEGKADEVVKVEAGALAKNKRVDLNYYTNPAADVTLVAGTDKYYVKADLVATITGADFVTAVGDYTPVVPETVTATLDKPVEGLAPESFTVKWAEDGATGTLVDADEKEIGITVKAADGLRAKTFDMADVVSARVQNNQIRTKDATVLFPKEITEGTVNAEMTVQFSANVDEQILFLDHDAIEPGTDEETGEPNGTVKSGNVFTYAGVQIVCNGTGFCPRNGSATENSILSIETGKPYILLFEINVTDNKYSLTILDETGKQLAKAADKAFRASGPIDGIAFVSNSCAGDANADGRFTATNIQINTDKITAEEVPAAATVKAAGITYLAEGETEVLAHVFELGGEYAGQTLKVVAEDAHKPRTGSDGIEDTVLDPVVLEDGQTKVAVVPNSFNVDYTAYIVDTDTGYILDWATAKAMSNAVVADLTANAAAYKTDETLAHIDQAVKALSDMGAVYNAENKFGDGRDEVITVEVADSVTTITVAPELFEKGIGFKGIVKAGPSSKVVATEDKAELYSKITIDGSHRDGRR